MDLDVTQSRVVEDIASGASLTVVGAAGTGKTTVLRGAVKAILARSPQARVAVLSPDRRAASDVRNEISVEVGALGEGVVIQSITAFAFSIVSAYAQAVGRREPELMSGPEQDAMIKDIFDLAGQGLVPAMSEALGGSGELAQLPAFRAEFRDLITRASELGLDASELRELGERYGIESWVTGSHVMDAYEGALATAAARGHGVPDRTDHARLVRSAAWIVEHWDEGIAAHPSQGQLGISRPQWDYVVVDDVQNATLSLVGLLRSLKLTGARVSTFGNPDLAVQGFRGGVAHLPSLIERDETDGGIGAELRVLATRYRGGGAIADLDSRISAGIHVAGTAKHRRPELASGVEGAARAFSFLNHDDQYAHIAASMRRRHLFDGVSFGEMAIITRGHGSHESVRRALASYDIPVQAITSATPLRDQRAVHGLLSLISLAQTPAGEAEASDVRDLLAGPLFTVDSVEMRVATRQLRGWELKTGGWRTDDELLLSVLDPSDDTVAAKVETFARLRASLARVREAISHGDLAEMVLWEAWDSLHIAEQWRREVLVGGARADSVNSDLDALMQLFRLAQRLADRDSANAGVDELVDILESQDVPEDSIARTGARGDEVALATASSTIGRSWTDVYVVDLNEGVWPNTKLRNPLTRVADLASSVVSSVFSGQEQPPRQSFSDVIDDELRMLLQSVTRAEANVVVCCVHSDEIKPSRFVDWLFITEAEDAELAQLERTDPFVRLHHISHVDRTEATLDTASLIGELRLAQTSGSESLAAHASERLAGLNREQVQGADPARWVDRNGVSAEGEKAYSLVSVSPSGVATALECPLRAFLEKARISSTTENAAADRGTLVHQIAEEHPDGDLEAMLDRLEQLWVSYGLGDGYFDRVAKQQTREMIRRLSVYLRDASTSSESELWGRQQIDNVVVRARIDRIDRDAQDDGRVKVIDFKTGKTMLSVKDTETDPQLMIYQWLAANGGIEAGAEKPPITSTGGAELVYVANGKSGPTLRTQEPLAADAMGDVEDLIVGVGELYRGPSYPARPSTAMCRTCEFASLCPARSGERIFSA